MKKLILLSAILILYIGCSKDNDHCHTFTDHTVECVWNETLQVEECFDYYDEVVVCD